MEARFQDHLERIDRLLALVHTPEGAATEGGPLTYHDLLLVTCEAMWGLKERLLNDPAFHANRDALREDIHAEWCLLTCGDLATGRKHLVFTRPVTGTAPGARGRFVPFYVSAPDPLDPFHGMEVHALLAQCRAAWQRIIDRHWLSDLPF